MERQGQRTPLLERQGQRINLWEHKKGKVYPGDFILVMEGELAGKEGFVKSILDDSNLMVVETSKEPAQPPVIFEGQQTDQQVDPNDEIVSFVLFFAPRSSIYLFPIRRHSSSLH